MSGLAVFMIVLAVVIAVIAFRGKQDNLIAAFIGHPYNKSDLR